MPLQIRKKRRSERRKPFRPCYHRGFGISNKTGRVIWGDIRGDDKYMRPFFRFYFSAPFISWFRINRQGKMSYHHPITGRKISARQSERLAWKYPEMIAKRAARLNSC